MMLRLVDILYRVGVGVLVCGTFYRLFITIIPSAFVRYGIQGGHAAQWTGAGLTIALGPLLSFKLADWLLRSVTMPGADDDLPEAGVVDDRPAAPVAEA
jgi:hypothetical protein